MSGKEVRGVEKVVGAGVVIQDMGGWEIAFREEGEVCGFRGEMMAFVLEDLSRG